MKNLLLSFPAAFALTGATAAQSTEFTYQGRLRAGGEPASGLHDFRFRLFDAGQGGAQLGETQCVNNVSVADGLFIAAIDFGQQFASPDQRFLEIQVREDTGLGCGNGAGFVTLAPRQPLTAAPLASHANSAFALDAADGSPLAAVVVDNSGRVGIGTNTPQATIELLANQGGDTPGEGIRIQGTTDGTDNLSYISFVNGAGTRTGYVGDGGGADNNVFLTSDFGDVLLYNSNIGPVLAAKTSGDVGIGTTQPLAKLDVHGDIRLGPSGQFLATSGEENLRIVRGSVRADGEIEAGSGFWVSHSGAGEYHIVFTTPFWNSPTVTASTEFWFDLPPTVATPDAFSADGGWVVIKDSADSFRADRDFHFIAVGPR